MKVKLNRNYKCAPQGHTTLQFNEGDTLEGRAAELALQDGAAYIVDSGQGSLDSAEKPAPKKRGRKPKVIKPAQPDEAKTPAPDNEG